MKIILWDTGIECNSSLVGHLSNAYVSLFFYKDSIEYGQIYKKSLIFWVADEGEMPFISRKNIIPLFTRHGNNLTDMYLPVMNKALR